MPDIELIYKDKNFLVVNKPASLLVHRARITNFQLPISKEFTLVDWLLENYPEVKKISDYYTEAGVARQSSAIAERRWGIVHRLDKETSGVMVIARNQETFDYLKSLFQKHQVKKTYLALVVGRVKDKTGRIEKPIGLKSGTVKRGVPKMKPGSENSVVPQRGTNPRSGRISTSWKMVKEAITDYRALKYLKIGDRDFTLLEVVPQTGRTHQIRVHLAAIGYPVAGDQLYGGKRTKVEGLSRQFLHAQSIEFTSPDGKRVKFEADLPEELAKFITQPN